MVLDGEEVGQVPCCRSFQACVDGSHTVAASKVSASRRFLHFQVCRTDTARPSRTPDFSSRSFLLRLPAAAAAQSGNHSSSLDAPDSDDAPTAKLAVSLFAAPSVEAPVGPIIAGAQCIGAAVQLPAASCCSSTTVDWHPASSQASTVAEQDTDTDLCMLFRKVLCSACRPRG